MQEHFIPYEQALHLKQLGFDEWCVAICNKDSFVSKRYDGTHVFMYQNSTSHLAPDTATLPLWQQVWNWARTKHRMHVCISYIPQERWHVRIHLMGWSDSRIHSYSNFADSFEEAQLTGLRIITEQIERVSAKTQK